MPKYNKKGKYKTVVIDPPWPIETGKLPKTIKKKSGKWGADAVHLDYEAPTVQEIKDFPMDEFAADECILFLWVTTGKAEDRPIIDIGFDLLDEWDFKYHQIITWAKLTGLCIWNPFNSRTEHILVGYRGNLPKVYAVMPNYFETKQLKHSEKPAKFYQMLRAWTPEPRIDIFARRAHIGFDGWGFEYVGEGPLAKYIYAEEGPLEDYLE